MLKLALAILDIISIDLVKRIDLKIRRDEIGLVLNSILKLKTIEYFNNVFDYIIW